MMTSSTSSAAQADKHDLLGLKYWFIIFLLIFGCQQMVHELNTSCDHYVSKVNLDTNKESSTFSEGLSRLHLRRITNFGPRPTGSPANEIHTPVYLLNYFHEMQKLSEQFNGVHIIEYEQHISQQGSFYMNFLNNRQMTSVYRNVKNLVLRISDARYENKTIHLQQQQKGQGKQQEQTRRRAILINCHFDSVTGSPGASDDFISCSLMMEMIRLFIVRQSHLHHDFLFLFNGAEENLMQASHAFVTQHRWMKDVNVFVNLEGAGSAGKLLLFQAGPGAPWLVDEFSRGVNRPFASVMGMEVFQSGLIPGDTDFRIFRDYGNIPGVDMAFINNGYIYHTRHDQEQRIPPACLQLAGDNILSFIESIATSPYVTAPGAYTHGDVIFFDILGFFMIHYHASCSVLVTCIAVIFFSISFYLEYCQRGIVLFHFMWKAGLNHVLALFCQAAVGLFIAMSISLCGGSLAWYARRYNLIGLYILPMTWTFFAYHSIISPWLFNWSLSSSSSSFSSSSSSKSIKSSTLVEVAHFYSAQLFLTLVILFCSLFHIYSSYILLIWLFFSLTSRLALKYLLHKFPILPKEMILILTRILFFSLPLLYHIYSMWSCHEVFVPVLGRSGPNVNPELFIVILLMLTTCFFPLQLAGDVYITKHHSLKQLLFFLFHLSLSFILCILLTKIGFPYDSSPAAPRSQRVIVMHVNRHFRNPDNIVEHFDSGLWLLSLDYNGKTHIQAHLPEVRDIEPIDCEYRPHCGIPQLYPLLNMFSQYFVIPTKSHSFQPQPQIQILSKVAVGKSRNLINVTMSIVGPTHNHILFMTDYHKVGVKLISWSLGDDDEPPIPIAMPASASGEHYFIYNSYGDAPKEALVIWTVFDVTNAAKATTTSSAAAAAAHVQVALSANYLTGYELTSPILSLIHAMPDWVDVTSWSATYESWTIDLANGIQYYE